MEGVGARRVDCFVCELGQLTLNNTGWNCVDPPIHGYYNTVTMLSLSYFIATIHYVTHITKKIWVNRLFLLLARLLVNGRLLVIKFLRSQKLYLDF